MMTLISVAMESSDGDADYGSDGQLAEAFGSDVSAARAGMRILGSAHWRRPPGFCDAAHHCPSRFSHA